MTLDHYSLVQFLNLQAKENCCFSMHGVRGGFRAAMWLSRMRSFCKQCWIVLNETFSWALGWGFFVLGCCNKWIMHYFPLQHLICDQGSLLLSSTVSFAGWEGQHDKPWKLLYGQFLRLLLQICFVGKFSPIHTIICVFPHWRDVFKLRWRTEG